MQYSNMGMVPDVAIPYVTQVQQQEQENKGEESNTKEDNKHSPSSPQHLEQMHGTSEQEVPSPEAIALLEMKKTLIGMLIDLIRKYHQMKLKDIVDYVNKNKETLIRLDGRKYSGSTDRIVLGALHSSKAFVQSGHSIWSLNSKIASEVETDIYERLRNRERQRKRKRRSNRNLGILATPNIICTPEQMELCLTRVLRDIRQESASKASSSSLGSYSGLTTTREEEKDDLFGFLHNIPFDNASLQDCANEMKEKWGDEGFCFVIQFFNFFREYLTHPTEMAARTSSRIDSALQEIQNDAKAPPPIPIGMPSISQQIPIEEISDPSMFELIKGRRASIPDSDNLLNERELNLNMGIGLPSETSNYNQIENLSGFHWSSQVNKEAGSQQMPMSSNTSSNPYFPISLFPTLTSNLPQNMMGQINSGIYEVEGPNNVLGDKNVNSGNSTTQTDHLS